jgi:hypothetical protein
MSGLDIPITLIVMAIMDYVAWQVFVSVAGLFAVFYMALLIVLEVIYLGKSVSNSSNGF